MRNLDARPSWRFELRPSFRTVAVEPDRLTRLERVHDLRGAYSLLRVSSGSVASLSRCGDPFELMKFSSLQQAILVSQDPEPLDRLLVAEEPPGVLGGVLMDSVTK